MVPKHVQWCVCMYLCCPSNGSGPSAVGAAGALPRSPVPPVCPFPTCCQSWPLMTHSFALLQPPHFGMPSQHRGTNDWLTLWCNSCSRAPHGIRLKLILIETIPIFSCPTPSLLPLGTMPPKSPRIPVSGFAFKNPDSRHSLTLPYLDFSIYQFLERDSTPAYMNLLHSFNSHMLIHSMDLP